MKSPEQEGFRFSPEIRDQAALGSMEFIISGCGKAVSSNEVPPSALTSKTFPLP